MRVQVNISDEMVQKIDDYAKQMGVTRSSLCSVLIGQGIMGYEKINDVVAYMGNQLSDVKI